MRQWRATLSTDVLIAAALIVAPGALFGETPHPLAGPWHLGTDVACETAAALSKVGEETAKSEAVADPEGVYAAAETQIAPADADAGCLGCHTDAGYLISTVAPAAPPPDDGCASAPSRPDFLRVFVNADFPVSFHGRLGCTGCHGGDGTATEIEAAHVGLQRGDQGCADCHGEIAARHETSLHHTLSGMAHALSLRSGAANFGALADMWEADCATCHTSCADCHLSLPAAVGGGLIQGHSFLRRAPMEESCALCHGSRAGGEYLGTFDGVAADVHYEAGLHCLDCHTNELHGDGQVYRSRWEVAGRAQCSDCHALLPNPEIAAHGAEHTDVACQVCHSQPYQNCFDCHSGEEDGVYFRRAGSKALRFEIGQNTAAGYPFGTVVLRNNPVARESFTYFGTDLLPAFDAHPTWKTAAPHNIRRITAQNERCGNCHTNPVIFLTEEDLQPDSAAANAAVLTDAP